MIEGQERRLSRADQRLLSTWAVKTALMLDLGHIEHSTIPEGFHREFQLRRSALPSHVVWIGGYRDSRRAA
jgi:hypothetical protein